jgi:hypothetical protein
MVWSRFEKTFFGEDDKPPAWKARAKDLECYIEDARAFLEVSATGPLDARICFVHVPKCAGITVDSAIRRTYRSVWEQDGGSLHRLHPGACDEVGEAYPMSNWAVRETVTAYYLAQSDTRYVSGHFQVSERLLDRFGDEYAFITLLRHPVDRWISHYLYNTYTPEDHHYHIDADIEEFLETDRARGIGQIFLSYFSGTGEMDPDERAASDEVFAEAKANLGRMDLVAFVERMEEFNRQFEETFGQKLNLMRRNVNPATDDEKAVDPDVREKIREVCREDIELYEEALEEFEKQGVVAS